jgi:hypothetical protein
MRRATLSIRLLAAGLAAGIAAPALAQSCVQSAERAAFEVRALQSQLMVTALTCSRDSDYNAFVRKFQRDLAGSFTTIQAHFRRTAGGSHQRATDGFITQLANDQSQDGLRQGTHFCPNAVALFPVALAQSNAAGLAEMSVERNVLNPMAAPACAERAPAARPQARPAAATRPAAQAR